MIIRLTQHQHRQVLKVVEWSRLQEELNAETRPGPKRYIDVRMPFTAWLMVQNLLVDHTFNRKGQLSRSVATSQFTALRNVARGVNAYKRHPAWRGVGMQDYQTEILYGWATDNVLLPRPLSNSMFVALVPRWYEEPIGPVTLWRPEAESILVDDRLFDESLHKVFAV